MMRSAKKHIILFYLSGVIILFACGKESSCIKSTGKTITEQRSVDGVFDRIKIEDNVNLILRQDSVSILKIEGGENLLPYITTEINGSTLEIANGNKCNFLRTYKKTVTVYLSTPNIVEIDYTGKGDISSSGVLNFSEFRFETHNGTGSVNLALNSDAISLRSHAGATDFTISGTTKDLYVFNGSNSWFYMNNLLANSVHVNSEGTGDVIISPINSLYAEIIFLGNIIYSGDPDVTIGRHTGSGKLIKQ